MKNYNINFFCKMWIIRIFGMIRITKDNQNNQINKDNQNNQDNENNRILSYLKIDIQI